MSEQAVIPYRLASLTQRPRAFRNIVELSPMINNDELVFYSVERIEHAQVAEMIRTGRLRLSRPLFEQEFAAGLNPGKATKTDLENIPELTRWLDAFFQIKEQAKFWMSLKPGTSPASVIATLIGQDYYDCMSGGCPKAKMEIYKVLASHPSVDQNEHVYPNKDGWLTFKDFFAEVGQPVTTQLLLSPTDLND